MIAATFGPGQVAFSLLWFFLFLIEIWLMIMVLTDVLRSQDLKGWAKAGWVVLVFALPLVGILAYLIARGGEMRAHQMQTLEEQEEAFRRYIQNITSQHRNLAQELGQLVELRDRGDISVDEYRKLKAKIVDEESVAA